MRKPIASCASLLLALLLVPAPSQARWMSPDTGRFQTMDSYEGTQEEPLSLHKYLYASGNPINLSDPSGMESIASALMSMTMLGGQFAQISPASVGSLSSARPLLQVAVDIVELFNARSDAAKVDEYLKTANDIFSQAKIKFVVGNRIPWDSDTTFRRTLGKMTAQNFGRRSNPRVPVAGENIAEITKGQNKRRISAYFTDYFDPPANPPTRGMAFSFSTFPSLAPAVFVNTAYSDVLAHEFGHILFEEPDLDGIITDHTDLMWRGHRDVTKIKLKQGQILKAREIATKHHLSH
jgi:hypothetical protein